MADAPTPWWLVYSPSGERPPRYRHYSASAAAREADRLAREHPGHEFYVLAPVDCRVAQAMVRQSFAAPGELLDDCVPF